MNLIKAIAILIATQIMLLGVNFHTQAVELPKGCIVKKIQQEEAPCICAEPDELLEEEEISTGPLLFTIPAFLNTDLTTVHSISERLNVDSYSGTEQGRGVPIFLSIRRLTI